MRKRRLASILCLTSLLFGLFATHFRVAEAQGVYNPYNQNRPGTVNRATGYAYNLGRTNTPYLLPQGQVGYGNQNYDPRYQAQYGRRFDPRYYQGSYSNTSGSYGLTSMIPSMLGAAAGAIVGGHFGFLGVALGGAVGFFLGRAAGKFMGVGNNYYNNYYGYQQGSGLRTLVPGIAGAILGAVVFSGMGAAGLLLGGAAGFFVAQAVSKLMFPQNQYGGQYYNPYNTPQQARYGVRFSDTAAQAPAAAPEGALQKASDTEAEEPAAAPDLAALQQAWHDALLAYKQALAGDATDEDTAAKRKAFVAAQTEYFEAKRQAEGEQEAAGDE